MGIERPSFVDINKLIGEACSTLTIDTRFPSQSLQQQDLQGLCTNLVFYPRSHFITTSYSPFPSFEGSSMPKYLHNLNPLTMDSFSVGNDFVSDWNYAGGYIVSSNLIYRGNNLDHFSAISATNNIRQLKKEVRFSISEMNGLKVDINFKRS